ncbi:hypothetical protein [Marinicella sp. W31]|uniref:hypothetical protein n=1 Tax=Marinicella sp. W31 TaxID=3023713 RepID=UPI0037566A82
MAYLKNKDAQWIQSDDHVSVGEPPGFTKELLILLNNLDKIFHKARAACEFEFICTLLSIKGMQDAGWDPYQTTVSTVSEVLDAANSLDNHLAQKNLQLWLYVHIMEASEPYEKLMNLIKVANGERFNPNNFPLIKGKRAWSPGEKIRKIIEKANFVGLDDQLSFLTIIWDRGLRNSISHSEYVFYPNELRTLNPLKKWPRTLVAEKINRAVAYHHAFEAVHTWYVSSYEKTKRIQTNKDFSSGDALVMIRKGHGVIGLKDAWTPLEIKQGAIPWRAARLSESESEILERAPDTTEF